MNAQPVSVAVIDRHRVFADALVYRLQREPQVRVVGAFDADAGLAAAIASAPDVAVLDAELPKGAAFDAAVEIRRAVPRTRLLFLMEAASDPAIDQALKVAADGILLRNEPLAELVQAISRAATGERTFSRSIAARINIDPASREMRLASERPASGLTTRQLEILRYLARGHSVKDVARKLLLSPKSVDNQKFRIMRKIGVADKVSLALYAVREGLIEP